MIYYVFSMQDGGGMGDRDNGTMRNSVSLAIPECLFLVAVKTGPRPLTLLSNCR